jgi:hypothetical protein
MFTLKLFYRKDDGGLVTKILPCHHVEAREFGKGDAKAIELWVFDGPEPQGKYDSYLIGNMEAQPGREDPNFISSGWFGWGLLENWEGNTTQHFRPASYG